MRPRVTVLLALACVLILATTSASAWASFGIEPGSLHVAATNRDGTPDLQAGSHPYAFTVSFNLNHDASGKAEGNARDVIVDLPRGLVGNPTAVPRCSRADFDRTQSPACPGATQVGTLHASVESISPVGPIYNLVPPPGVAARLGFSAAGFNALLDASVLTGEGYGVAVTDNLLPRAATLSVSSTIWGDPADSAHDPERSCVDRSNGEIDNFEGCASGATPKPFLTLPTSCTGPLATTVKLDSIEAPGDFIEQTAYSTDTGGDPVGLSGCSRLPFTPTIEVQPETSASATATGLRVDLHVPQPETVEGLAEAHLRDAVVTLPAGMVVNPSSANGLQGCSSVQIGLDDPAPASCPDASKIGSVEVDTPLVDHPLPGAVYLAAQGDNPFGSLLAIYVVVDDPQTGVIVKLAGHVQADPATGQLTTTFSENPQLPFEDFKLDFFGGPRAPLTTPETCGAKTTTTTLTPWTAPEGSEANPSSTFQISAGPGGGPCVGAVSEEPNRPSFEAGTTQPVAASYSPFVLDVGREDGSQPFGSVSVTLPPGLTGKLAGVARCSDAAIAAAAGRSGSQEIASPSCPQSSEVGTVDVAAGAGPIPVHVGGRAYLAGPYKGAPFSLAIITPAVAGPYDLGTVVVRSALYINAETAQVTAASDPIPTILQGIPLDVRRIIVNMSRREFVLNPTSCDPMALAGTMTSAFAQPAPLVNRFQVGGCSGLPFRPSFAISTEGKTSKATGASLTVKVRAKPGEANIRKVDLQLPLALPARLTTLQKACTEAQFNANPAACPEASQIGTATAHTPILDASLVGPAYLVSHGNAAFPDVEFVLQGEGVTIVLDGKTDIKKGITYSRFEAVPDAPISSFEASLPEGPHSALAANRNLCSSARVVSTKKRVTRHVRGRIRHLTVTAKKRVAEPLLAPTTLIGQNGAVVTQATKIAVTGCGKAKAQKSAGKPHRANGRRKHKRR